MMCCVYFNCLRKQEFQIFNGAAKGVVMSCDSHFFCVKREIASHPPFHLFLTHLFSSHLISSHLASSLKREKLGFSRGRVGEGGSGILFEFQKSGRVQ